MLTKNDYIELEKRFVTHDMFNNAVREILDFIADFRKEMLEKFDETHDMLENHGRRIEKLEDKVFS